MLLLTGILDIPRIACLNDSCLTTSRRSTHDPSGSELTRRLSLSQASKPKCYDKVKGFPKAWWSVIALVLQVSHCNMKCCYAFVVS